MSVSRYIRVKWIHSLPDEPVELWSELDPGRFELRKIEIWADGRVGYAAAKMEVGGTFLGIESVPPLDEIASDPQFRPEEITQSDFEQAWARKVR